VQLKAGSILFAITLAWSPSKPRPAALEENRTADLRSETLGSNRPVALEC
jgi:hypothetical protein